MTFEAFRTMPHRLGWKHEYWDGMARLSPAWTANLTLAYPLRHHRYWRSRNSPPVPLGGLHIRRVRPADFDGLLQLHLVAFDDAVEYAGYPEDVYRDRTAVHIETFFGGPAFGRSRRGDPPGIPEHSFVAVDPMADDLAAALLVRNDRDLFDDERYPTIAPVMVRSRYRRRFLATALFTAAADSLAATAGVDELRSHCQLSNTASIAWHRRVGFCEVPTSHVAGHRAGHHFHMADHHAAAGRADLAALHREVARAQRQLHDVCQESEMERYRRQAE